MLSTKQAHDLAVLSDQIHEQMLRDYGSSADAPTALAHRTLHRLLTGMVNGEDTSGHARVTFAAPTGFGKSSACAAFLIAAYQLGFLGKCISVTYAANRVSQLYDFEAMLLDNGLPALEIRGLVSVLHGSEVDGRVVVRKTDTDSSVPVLLITHERIRAVYRRAEGWAEKDLCYFMKFRGRERSMVLWDERCTTTESRSVDVELLRGAVATLAEIHGKAPAFAEMLEWLQRAKTSILEQSTIPALDGDTNTTFYNLLPTVRGLGATAYTTLREFLESLRFNPTVVTSEQNGKGVVHYKVTLPDQAKRVVNLDASYGVSLLSQIGSKHALGFIDAETFCHDLKEMYRVYRKRLIDLKDCSKHTFIHWNHGGGKDVVKRDTEAYLAGKAEGGNVILELLEMVRHEVAAGKAIIVWTHSKGTRNEDLQRAVEQCLNRAGLLDGLTYKDLAEKDSSKQAKPQVVVDHYGQHDATNAYSYTQVAILLGVMQRHECELAGAICGEKRDINSTVDPREVRQVKVADRATTVLQTVGRSISRKVVNGVCGQQTTYLIYKDRRVENLSAVIRPAFPKATWEMYRPKFAMMGEGIVETWAEKVAQYLRETDTAISSRKLKQTVEATQLASMTWKRIVRLAMSQVPYVMVGQTVTPTFNTAA